MEGPDWTQFTRLIYINAPIEKLYKLWATQEGLESWFLRSAHFHRNGVKLQSSDTANPGDDYEWKWHNWDGETSGRILEANGKDLISFDFDDSLVTVKLYEGRGKVCVDLQQTNIPIDDLNKYRLYHGCSCGWTFWLANMKALMEHGITLNDTDPGITDIHRDMNVVNI